MNEQIREQFGRIYDQYIEKIYRFVYLKVSATEVAEDITSRVFIKTFESYQKDQDIQNMTAFLYRLARNAVIDHWRQKGRVSMVSVDDIAQLPDQSQDVHARAEKNAQLETVKQAIGRLDKDDQDIIIWYYLEDMDSEEIAKILNRPPGTVRVMIHRALGKLKGTLNPK